MSSIGRRRPATSRGGSYQSTLAYLGEGVRFFVLVGWCSLWPSGMGCVAGSSIPTYSKIKNSRFRTSAAKGRSKFGSGKIPLVRALLYRPPSSNTQRNLIIPPRGPNEAALKSHSQPRAMIDCLSFSFFSYLLSPPTPDGGNGTAE